MKLAKRDYIFLFGIASIIVIVDQITKALVRANIPLNGSWMPIEWLAPYVRFIFIFNSGVAFGMFQNANWFFLIVGLIIAVGMIIYYPHVPQSEWVQRLAVSMMLGGAIGNLIDRIVFGQVTDFVSVVNFAIFNVADSCITVGVGVLLLGIWLQERRETKEKSSAAKENPAVLEKPKSE